MYLYAAIKTGRERMEFETDNLKEKMYSWLVSEIRDAEASGINIEVDGVRYSLKDTDKLRNVMENHYYMKSYIGDDNGKIVQINFEQIISM